MSVADLFDVPFEEEPGLLGESGRPRHPVTVQTTGSNPVQVANRKVGGDLFDVHTLRNGDLLMVYLASQTSEKLTPTDTPWLCTSLFRYEGVWYTKK